MSLPRISQAHSSVVAFRTAAERRQDLLGIAEIDSCESLGRPLSKHLINGFIVHFRGLSDTQRIRRRNFTGTYATVNNFFPPRTYKYKPPRRDTPRWKIKRSETEERSIAKVGK